MNTGTCSGRRSPRSMLLDTIGRLSARMVELEARVACLERERRRSPIMHVGVVGVRATD